MCTDLKDKFINQQQRGRVIDSWGEIINRANLGMEVMVWCGVTSFSLTGSPWNFTLFSFVGYSSFFLARTLSTSTGQWGEIELKVSALPSFSFFLGIFTD